MRQNLFLIAAFAMLTVACYAQPEREVMSGIVRDAKSLMPVSDAFIRVADEVAVSNIAGEFTIPAKIGDTLVCHHLGYETQVISILNVKLEFQIFLVEAATMLDSVTVYPSIEMPMRPFAPAKPVKLSFSNTSNNSNDNVVPTIGPSVVFIGLLSSLTRSARAEKKYKREKEKLEKTRVYTILIADPSSKERVQTKFKINDELYYKGLEKFNVDYSHVAYWTDEREIFELLFYFFAEYIKTTE